MKELSFYEQVGIVLPGSMLLLGILALAPELRPLFADKGLTVGGLGLFVLIAYALGHLIAALGNLLEVLVWWPAGGMPSTWLRDPKRDRLLVADQREAVRLKLASRLRVQLSTLSGVDKGKWKGVFRLIYGDVLANSNANRVETFNGNYGLNRGLAASLLIVAGACALARPDHWRLATGGLLVGALIYVFRMCRFGLYFAREVYARFLLLPDAQP